MGLWWVTWGKNKIFRHPNCELLAQVPPHELAIWGDRKPLNGFNLLRFFGKFFTIIRCLFFEPLGEMVHPGLKCSLYGLLNAKFIIEFTSDDGFIILGCSCHASGVSPVECPPGGGACLCDPVTGACPCLPNVTGLACDRCADGYWNLVPGRGCQSCDCDPRTSQSSHCDQARYFKTY